MTKPANDEEIVYWGLDALEPYPTHQDTRLLALIARIRSEQEEAAKWKQVAQYNSDCFQVAREEVGRVEDRADRLHGQLIDAYDATAAAEALASSIREKTIRECAEVVRTWAEDHKTIQPSFTGMTTAILALLEPTP